MPGRRVLVVDDNRDAADSLGLLLETVGHEARVAHGGPEALDLLEGWQAEVVLLDIGMPVMDGYEVARRIRAMPQMAGAVLIALSGWGQEGDRDRSRTEGFDRHLVKPVTLKDLLAELDSLSAAGNRDADTRGPGAAAAPSAPPAN